MLRRVERQSLRHWQCAQQLPAAACLPAHAITPSSRLLWPASSCGTHTCCYLANTHLPDCLQHGSVALRRTTMPRSARSVHQNPAMLPSATWVVMSWCWTPRATAQSPAKAATPTFQLLAVRHAKTQTTAMLGLCAPTRWVSSIWRLWPADTLTR